VLCHTERIITYGVYLSAEFRQPDARAVLGIKAGRHFKTCADPTEGHTLLFSFLALLLSWISFYTRSFHSWLRMRCNELLFDLSLNSISTDSVGCTPCSVRKSETAVTIALTAPDAELAQIRASRVPA
jgi:hypothetical protein